jgi:deoxyribose-phosphate aldolase
VRAACPQQRLKLIIESGELPLPETIRQASRIGLDAGVDFLKTSTGKTAHGASPEAARLMLECIAMQPRKVGFKASGGIRTVADAAAYIELAREHLGAGAIGPQRLRFGASGLLGDIERVLSGSAGAARAASEY